VPSLVSQHIDPIINNHSPTGPIFAAYLQNQTNEQRGSVTA